MLRAPLSTIRTNYAVPLLLLVACVAPPPAARWAAIPKCAVEPTFDRTAYVDDMQFSSTIGAVSRMLSADYTTGTDNVHTANNASEGCKKAQIVIAYEVLTPVSDKAMITAALEGGKKTGPGARAPECACLKDGAMQDDLGLCKAQVFQTSVQLDVFQVATDAAKPPYSKFWTPNDPRYPSGAGGKVIKCTIPKFTVVAVGVKKNPNQTTSVPAGSTTAAAEEYYTYWYIGDTWGTVGNKDNQPRSWKCTPLE